MEYASPSEIATVFAENQPENHSKSTKSWSTESGVEVEQNCIDFNG